MSEGALLFLAIPFFLFLALLFWGVFVFNRLIRARNQEREGWSGIEVQLRKRHDLVPLLAESVRGYKKHEQSVLLAVTQARAAAEATPSRTDEAERALSVGLQKLFALAEAYPELKANANFLKFSQQLVEVEEHLQFARRYYNGSVRDFRNLAQTFPNNLIAKLFRFQPAEFFEVDSALERQPPPVEMGGQSIST